MARQIPKQQQQRMPARRAPKQLIKRLAELGQCVCLCVPPCEWRAPDQSPPVLFGGGGNRHGVAMLERACQNGAPAASIQERDLRWQPPFRAPPVTLSLRQTSINHALVVAGPTRRNSQTHTTDNEQSNRVAPSGGERERNIKSNLGLGPALAPEWQECFIGVGVSVVSTFPSRVLQVVRTRLELAIVYSTDSWSAEKAQAPNNRCSDRCGQVAACSCRQVWPFLASETHVSGLGCCCPPCSGGMEQTLADKSLPSWSSCVLACVCESGMGG